VVAIEGHRPPWPLPGPAVELRCGDAAPLLAAAAAAGERFDRCLLDPPRTGARELLEPLAAIGPERIVYVSCDPATLGRDLDDLAGRGYRALWARPVDLMPQTAHIEVVAVLERDPPASG
jgi:23S rRNA (uracil1939-C5)-methyltransferase